MPAMDMDEELVYYNALAILVRRARDQAEANPYDKRTAELGLLVPTKRGQDPRPALERHFDQLEKTLADTFLLRLVAAFESTVFARLTTAIGAARTVVQENFPSALPFSGAAQKLVRVIGAKGISNLSDIEDLARSYPGAAADNLGELREHRNLIAHGGRIGSQSTFADPVEVHRALSDLLATILGNGAAGGGGVEGNQPEAGA